MLPCGVIPVIFFWGGKCNCSNGSAPACVDKGMECIDLSCCSTGWSGLAVDNVATAGGSA